MDNSSDDSLFTVEKPKANNRNNQLLTVREMAPERAMQTFGGKGYQKRTVSPVSWDILLNLWPPSKSW